MTHRRTERTPGLHRIRPILVALLVLLVAVPVAAQSARDYDAPEDFDGFQALANRFYIHDPRALEEIVSSGDIAPEDYPPVMAIVMVMVFDTDEHAGAAFVPYSELMAGSVSGEMEQSATPEPRGAPGEDTLVFRAVDDADGYPVDVTTITVREGEVIYLALAMTANGTSGDLSGDLMTFMLERVPGEDDVDFDEAGGSTGGPFALFPTEDDVGLLRGMDVQSDQYIDASNS